MQDIAMMYIDFVLTLNRSLEFLKDIVQKDLASFKDIDINILLSLYYFDDQLTKDEHLILKGFNYESKPNVIKKLIELGFLVQADDEERQYDLTESGIKMKSELDKIFNKHAKLLSFKGLMVKEVGHVLTVINRFNTFWEGLLDKDD